MIFSYYFPIIWQLSIETFPLGKQSSQLRIPLSDALAEKLPIMAFKSLEIMISANEVLEYITLRQLSNWFQALRDLNVH